MNLPEIARPLCRLALSASVVLGTGCGGSDSDTTTPTSPSAVLATETFTGTINPLGSASHTFTVTYATAYTNASMTITTLATIASSETQPTTIGVGFGTTNVGVCTRSANFTNAAAPLNTELATNGAPFIAGTYCIQLFDNAESPTITEPVAYSVTVKHY